VEDGVDVWRYAILELLARNDDDDDGIGMMLQWHWDDAAVVLGGCCNGIGMMLQWHWEDAAMVLG